MQGPELDRPTRPTTSSGKPGTLCTNMCCICKVAILTSHTPCLFVSLFEASVKFMSSIKYTLMCTNLMVVH